MADKRWQHPDSRPVADDGGFSVTASNGSTETTLATGINGRITRIKVNVGNLADTNTDAEIRDPNGTVVWSETNLDPTADQPYVLKSIAEDCTEKYDVVLTHSDPGSDVAVTGRITWITP